MSVMPKLVAVVVVEIAAAVDTGDVVFVGRVGPDAIDELAGFHLDHLGAVVRQVPGAERAGHIPGEVGYLDVF